MLAKRVVTSIVLALVGLPAIFIGGIPYLLIIALILGFAAWEYVVMFRTSHLEPSAVVTLGGTLAILVARSLYPESAVPVFTLLVLAAMTVHLLAYERGRNQAATDFTVTLGGIAYFGWVGAYLLDLRGLPNGQWWLMLVLPSVWLADSGAYFVGARWGTHQLTSRLSPKKTWEGYWAGVVTGTLGGVLLAWLWQRFAGLEVNLMQGALVGSVMALFTTLGDLGESMFKRQAGFKDSGNLFPGHGGVFDRIDSWLWAAALGYFLIRWFVL
jgi:phosphatidate cytidylyltransferase